MLVLDKLSYELERESNNGKECFSDDGFDWEKVKEVDMVLELRVGVVCLGEIRGNRVSVLFTVSNSSHRPRRCDVFTENQRVAVV